ncbi:MAG: hypothetical protein AVDCRST_MAG85-1939, partial [uncultured Solirubrobacteraceae bacterium]
CAGRWRPSMRPWRAGSTRRRGTRWRSTSTGTCSSSHASAAAERGGPRRPVIRWPSRRGPASPTASRWRH